MQSIENRNKGVSVKTPLLACWPKYREICQVIKAQRLQMWVLEQAKCFYLYRGLDPPSSSILKDSPDQKINKKI